MNVAHYSSWAFWGDSATGFHYFTDSEGNLNHTYTATVNEEIELGYVRSYSDWMNGGIPAFEAEPYDVVYCGTKYGVPSGELFADENGFVKIKFSSPGTWYLWTDGGYGSENPMDIVSAPAFAANKKSQCLHSYVLQQKLHNPTETNLYKSPADIQIPNGL